MDAQVGALGEVLAQQSVGVLVRPALPRAVGITEIHGHVQCGGDPFVQGELRSLVPCQAVPEELGQALHLVDDGLLDVFGVVSVGQVQQDREPGGALHERADGVLVARAGDQVALPMAGNRPVLDFRRPLADHDHGLAEPGLPPAVAAGFALGPALPHGAFQLLSELALGLQVDGLVDRLDARVHIPIIREVRLQTPGYLLGAPMFGQSGEDPAPQRGALGRLPRLWPFEPIRALLLGPVGLVVAGGGIPVASDLTADGSRIPSQQARDGADPVAKAQPVGDGRALLLAQVSRMNGFRLVHGGTIPVHRRLLVPSRGARPAVAPRLACALRDAHRAGRLGEVQALLVQQAHVLHASPRTSRSSSGIRPR